MQNVADSSGSPDEHKVTRDGFVRFAMSIYYEYFYLAVHIQGAFVEIFAKYERRKSVKTLASTNAPVSLIRVPPSPCLPYTCTNQPLSPLQLYQLTPFPIYVYHLARAFPIRVPPSPCLPYQLAPFSFIRVPTSPCLPYTYTKQRLFPSIISMFMFMSVMTR